MTLTASLEYIIIHCGTNNLGHTSPIKIAKNLHIFGSCLLPRDNEQSVDRSLLYAVNSYLKKLRTNEFHYIELDCG